MTETLQAPTLENIPLDQLKPSKFNHRKSFDEAEMQDLAASITANGVLQALNVRPILKKGAIDHYEIGGGERRWRAARRAGLTSVPCLVRPMEDPQFVTLINVENLQRADVHPLEEAEGYVDLMHVHGADIAKLSEIVGKSEPYIRDRMQLLKLVPAATDMFREDRFTLGHAIEISRQTREVQERIIKVRDEETNYSGPLWNRADESGLFAAHETDEREKDPFFGLSPISVKELKSWINKHVRFYVTDEIAPTLFPETVALVQDAADMKLKTLAITYLYRMENEVKGGRIYGPDAWRRADGSEDAPKCNSSDVGLVVAGPHRGEAFAVCVDKKHCDTHWADEIKAAKREERSDAKTEKAASAGDVKAQKKLEKEQKARAEAEAKRVREERVRKIAKPAIIAGAVDRVAKAKASDCGVKGFVGKYVLDGIQGTDLWFNKDDFKGLAKAGSADAIVRLFARKLITLSDYDENTERDAKTLGVNIAKIQKDAVAQIAKEDKAAAKKNAD